MRWIGPGESKQAATNELIGDSTVSLPHMVTPTRVEPAAQTSDRLD